jgi:hypothetical protein
MPNPNYQSNQICKTLITNQPNMQNLKLQTKNWQYPNHKQQPYIWGMKFITFVKTWEIFLCVIFGGTLLTISLKQALYL